MVTYLLVLACLVLFMFFIEREKKGFHKLDFRGKYQKVIVLAVLGLLPLLFVSLFIPSVPQDKGAFYEKLTNGRHEIGRLNVELEGLEYKCAHEPSYKNFVEYFHVHDKAYAYNCQELRDFVRRQGLKKDKEIILMGLIKTICNNQAHTEEDLQVSKNEQPGYNYARALNFYYLGYHDSASVYFYKETAFSDLKESTYRYLEVIARGNPESTRELYLDWEAIRYLPNHPKQEYYFKNQHFKHYTFAIYYDFYSNVQWLTIIIAFMVCAIWIFYVRSIDMFEKESWLNIATVFILSWAATNLCYFGYDFFNIHLDWSLAGENSAFSDFWYCTVVIGGCEELIKLIPWVLFLLINRKAANEPYDYLLYAAISALGFAGAENVMYYERYDMAVISTRAIMSSVGHMFFASLIAYSYVLMKYRFQNKTWKYTLPVLGFIAACISHGFYDFWLLSPSAQKFSIITFFFFIASLHIWKNFKNNALNHSTHYNYKKRLSRSKISFILLSGFIIILMIEYVVTSYQLGHNNSSVILKSSSLFMAFFGIYLITTFEDFKLRKGKWAKIKWPFQERVMRLLDREVPDDLLGLQLRLFSPKDNPFVGQQFPVTGHLQKELVIDGVGDWYMLEVNQTIHVVGYESKSVIVRSKTNKESLEDERIEIILLLIPLGMYVQSPELKTTDFRYVGRTYASPV